MTNKISISLFRVSSDSKYLDMIFDCPSDYYFNSLQLQIKYYEGNTLKTQWFDLSAALFVTVLPQSETDPEPTVNKKHWTVRLPLEKLGINFPAIYLATLKAQPVFGQKIETEDFSYQLPIPYQNINNFEVRSITGEVYPKNGTEPVIDSDGNQVYGKILGQCDVINTEEIIDTMICSDVNYAYKCMLDDILNSSNVCDPCNIISDEAIRKYLILYGHQAALSANDLETAEMYFKLINNCFDKCGVSDRKSTSKRSCNCGK